VAAYLEKLPAMAEEDRQRRVSFYAQDTRMARESAAREVAQRKLEAMLTERYG